MIKALSLAAALAVLPLSAAVAQEDRGAPEAAIETAAAAFEARMESFGERAEAISNDTGLTDAQRGQRIAALWTEYEPDVTAFTAMVTEHAGAVAGQALAEVNIEAVVAEALAGVETSGALAMAQGVAANGAWTSGDPEHMATYGLMANYALGEAMDAMDQIGAAPPAEGEEAAPTPEAD